MKYCPNRYTNSDHAEHKLMNDVIVGIVNIVPLCYFSSMVEQNNGNVQMKVRFF